jgi:hypothetical protein
MNVSEKSRGAAMRSDFIDAHGGATRLFRKVQ